MRGPALQALCRELGDTHMVQALSHVNEAQKHLRLAEEQLMFVESVHEYERRAAELRARTEQLAFGLGARLEHLRAKGGPQVDADVLRTEVERRRSDRDQQTLAQLLAGWRELCEHHEISACTVRDAMTWLREELEARRRTPGRPDRFDRLLVAVELLCPANGRELPDAHSFTYVLRKMHGRVHDGQCLKFERTLRGTLWRVRPSVTGPTQDAAQGAQ